MKTIPTDTLTAPAYPALLPVLKAACQRRRQHLDARARLSDLCSVGGTLTRSAQGQLPISIAIAVATATAEKAETTGKEALARETDPARGNVSSIATFCCGNDNTYNLDR